MIPAFLKKDQLIIGILLGLVLPVLFYGLLWMIDQLVYTTLGSHMVAYTKYLYLLSTLINLYPIRVYLVNLKMEKSGKGVLLVSFLMIILYFLLSNML